MTTRHATADDLRAALKAALPYPDRRPGPSSQRPKTGSVDFSDAMRMGGGA